VLVPFYTTLFGYFPGKRLRKVGDLPAGAVFQWSRWCRQIDYSAAEPGARESYGRVRVPLLSLSFTDDEMMSRRSIDSMHDCYANAQQQRLYISPQEAGARRIGHFGFFRPQFENTLWRQAQAWLDAHSKQPSHA
jgi:predicted alpha/beta hydrolase